MIFQILGILLLSLGVWMLVTWDRGLDNKTFTIVIILSILFIFLGVKLTFDGVNPSVLWHRVLGIAIGFAGVFCIVGFPDVTPDYQSPGMSWLMVFIGIILMVVAVYLLII